MYVTLATVSSTSAHTGSRSEWMSESGKAKEENEMEKLNHHFTRSHHLESHTSGRRGSWCVEKKPYHRWLAPHLTGLISQLEGERDRTTTVANDHRWRRTAELAVFSPVVQFCCVARDRRRYRKCWRKCACAWMPVPANAFYEHLQSHDAARDNPAGT